MLLLLDRTIDRDKPQVVEWRHYKTIHPSVFYPPTVRKGDDEDCDNDIKMNSSHWTRDVDDGGLFCRAGCRRATEIPQVIKMQIHTIWPAKKRYYLNIIIRIHQA